MSFHVVAEEGGTSREGSGPSGWKTSSELVTSALPPRGTAESNLKSGCLTVKFLPWVFPEEKNFDTKNPDQFYIRN